MRELAIIYGCGMIAFAIAMQPLAVQRDQGVAVAALAALWPIIAISILKDGSESPLWE